MAKNINQALETFFHNHLDPFTGEEFRTYLLNEKIKFSREEVESMLYGNDFVFPLQNNKFVTRAGVFSNRIFSFKPTMEEFKAGAFVPGHRFMPFLNPMEFPYNARLIANNQLLERVSVEISINTAMDLHSLMGEGYIIPYLFDDPANVNFNINAFKQNSLPKTVTLTGFSLRPFIDCGFKYGDRILCRVIDWENSTIEITFLPNSKTTSINESTLERAQWYKDFESGFLRIMDKLGPCASIEQQLAYLFLEEQNALCKLNCGSCEEFLRYTEKIGFKFYGVESRIWKSNEEIPFVGPWNKELAENHRLPEIEMFFSERIYDAILKNEIFITDKNVDLEVLAKKMLPECIFPDDTDLKFLLLNMKKRTSIILKLYKKFNDIEVAPLRKRLIPFFMNVRNLVVNLAYSDKDLSELPQNSLIILVQIADHLVRMIDEMEVWPMKFISEEEEINLSLDGMMETFEDIKYDLNVVPVTLEKSNFKIVK